MTEKQKHVSELIDRAVLADLDLGTLAGRQDADIAADYNGCGPEWLPGFIREKLTSFLALFEPAFLIHDSDFASSDGSTFAFAQANDRLEMNCLRLSSYTYPWWSWRRYRAHLAALEIASLCRRYGWKAYCSARSVHGQGSGLPEAPSVPSATIPCMLYALALLALAGCHSAPKAKDVSLKGMYANTATETVAIGSAKITVLPEAIESFVAHYSEDTAWLRPSVKTHFLDIYLTGTNTTSNADTIVENICKAFVEKQRASANPAEETEE